jgi:1-phosphatidylinositol phosphodiesterase
MPSKLLLLVLLPALLLAQLYNHQSSTRVDSDWLGALDNGIPLRKLSMVGSHSSMSQGTWGDAFQTQANSLSNQLTMGIRALDIRCRHYQNTFPIHDRMVYLNKNLGDVLATVKSFLAAHPM